MPFQEFKIDNLEEFPKELESMLSSQLERIDSIVKSDNESYEEVMKPLQDLDEELEELGEEWINPNLLRIGASSLLIDIERQLYHHAFGRYATKDKLAMA